MNDVGNTIGDQAEPIDFFISYTGADTGWAEWLAWCLEVAGYRVVLQAWDIRPGHNFALMMQRGLTAARRTLAVLSPAFLEANYVQPEWAAAFAADAQGLDRKLIPVRVRPCKPKGLLLAIVYVDLVGVRSEHEAMIKLLDGVCIGRGKASWRPNFPGSRPLR